MIKYLLLLILLAPIVSAEIYLSEVLPDPAGTDTKNEWIELYNSENTPIILNNYSLKDESTKFFYLDNITIPNQTYLIIYPTFTLNNGADSVFLYLNNIVIDNMSYKQTEENISFSFVNGNWTETIPTPGYENYIDTTCDFSVIILAEELQEDFSFKTYIEKMKGINGNLTLFRNIQTPYGQIMEEYDPLNLTVTNHNTIQNSPSLENGRAYLINVAIATECNDSNLENNHAEEIIFLKGEDEILSNEPFAKIMQIYGENYEFGDRLRVRVSVNKGISKKKSITLTIENLSVKNSFQSFTKTPQDFDMYLELPAECEKKSKTGNYTLRLEAFGAMDRKKIEISSNKTCKEEQTDDQSVIYESGPCEMNFTENIINIDTNFSTLSIIYESAQTGAKNLGIYMFGGLMLVLCMGLIIWKQKFWQE